MPPPARAALSPPPLSSTVTLSPALPRAQPCHFPSGCLEEGGAKSREAEAAAAAASFRLPPWQPGSCSPRLRAAALPGSVA